MRACSTALAGLPWAATLGGPLTALLGLWPPADPDPEDAIDTSSPPLSLAHLRGEECTYRGLEASSFLRRGNSPASACDHDGVAMKVPPGVGTGEETASLKVCARFSISVLRGAHGVQAALGGRPPRCSTP
mmetsp:Transcript_43768/g.117648  ORF Transcript_43768/g.117648 Transcript_43768/m.117648 type:complete len:131 (-) Transcript_43768:275-667(-)